MGKISTAYGQFSKPMKMQSQTLHLEGSSSGPVRIDLLPVEGQKLLFVISLIEFPPPTIGALKDTVSFGSASRSPNF